MNEEGKAPHAVPRRVRSPPLKITVKNGRVHVAERRQASSEVARRLCRLVGGRTTPSKVIPCRGRVSPESPGGPGDHLSNRVLSHTGRRFPRSISETIDAKRRYARNARSAGVPLAFRPKYGRDARAPGAPVGFSTKELPTPFPSLAALRRSKKPNAAFIARSKGKQVERRLARKLDGGRAVRFPGRA